MSEGWERPLGEGNFSYPVLLGFYYYWLVLEKKGGGGFQSSNLRLEEFDHVMSWILFHFSSEDSIKIKFSAINLYQHKKTDKRVYENHTRIAELLQTRVMYPTYTANSN